MIRISFLFVLLACCYSCKTEQSSAQEIVDKAIHLAGGDAYNNFEIEFDFRGRHYRSKRHDGNFEYVRVTTDSADIIEDRYSNYLPFKRTRNGIEEILPDSLSSRIENSINSVNYFIFLPNGLNDDAVNKSYLETKEVKSKLYHKLKITFDKEGGGKDFEDVFVYWINTESFTVDYLAYQYFTDEGGLRFRQAYNERIINGIRFVDYRNYKPKSSEATLFDLDQRFEQDELQLLSLIETENIIVN